MKIFEKFAAFIFLLLLISMIAFLTYVPVPDESKQVILIIIGGLMTTSATALPNLFGAEDTEKEKMRERLIHLESEHTILKDSYDTIMSMLVDRHVISGEGISTELEKYKIKNKNA